MTPTEEEQSSKAQPSLTLDLFLLKQGEGEPRVHNLAAIPELDRYQEVLRSKSLFVGEAQAAAKYCARDGLRLQSAYIDLDGTVFILWPHSHDQTARVAIVQANLPVDYSVTRETLRRLDFRDLTIITGILRAQFYPHGVGVSVDFCRPPKAEQVDALITVWLTTRREVFVSEVYWWGELAAVLGCCKDLEDLLAEFQPQTALVCSEPLMALREFVTGRFPTARLVEPGRGRQRAIAS